MANLNRVVLKKLFSRRVIGRSHLRLETLKKCGWKPHEKGLVDETVKNLIKKGLIVWAKKSKKAITLNKERIAEIKALIGEGNPPPL